MLTRLSFESTYEELKLEYILLELLDSFCFESTYEELKLLPPTSTKTMGARF